MHHTRPEVSTWRYNAQYTSSSRAPELNYRASTLAPLFLKQVPSGELSQSPPTFLPLRTLPTLRILRISPPTPYRHFKLRGRLRPNYYMLRNITADSKKEASTICHAKIIFKPSHASYASYMHHKQRHTKLPQLPPPHLRVFVHASIECPGRLLPLVTSSIPLDWHSILTQQPNSPRLQATYQSA